MHRLKGLKSGLAALLTAAMLFTGSSAVIYAEEAPVNAAIEEVKTAKETAVLTDDSGESSESGTSNESGEKGSDTETSVGNGSSETGKDAGGDAQSSEKFNIEINQGFSFHVKKDQEKGQDPTYMSNFVAGKKTYVMIPIKADNEDQAKEKTKDWKLHYKKVTDGNEGGDEEPTFTGNDFSFQQYYDENSNTVSGNLMAYVSFGTGPSKGKYNFYLDNGETQIAEYKDVDFYETTPLNILAVPVTSYYSESANVQESGRGTGCPKDKVGAPVPCEDDFWKNWEGTGKTAIEAIKEYMLDVYPIADINIDEGNTLDAGSAEFDMCTADGQKKLWDEANKLQSKNKETGKDKYDLILAFVMYRQDKSGCGQGYTYGKPTNIITLTDWDMLPTVAHEIAHCYDVGDEYDGGSYNYRVNDLPITYTSKARDKETGEEIGASRDYMFNNVSSYGSDDSKYYWLSGSDYKKAVEGDGSIDKVGGMAKDSIDTAGNGTVIYPSLHPFILSKGQFVQFATKDNTVYPTVSYMGSGYSGNENYYFTTSVIWDHLFEKLRVKTKKPDDQQQENSGEQQENSGDQQEANTESISILAADDADSDGSDDSETPDDSWDDIPENEYYDDDYREGPSRMVEVSGSVEYSDNSDKPTVSGCEVDPMFSYDGDLSYMDYFEDDDLTEEDKGKVKDDRFVFAAIGADGKVMKASDGEAAMTEFYGGNFNSAMPAPMPGEGMEDKRYQDFCEFSFDAPYPEGTKKFIILKEKDFDEKTDYNTVSDNVLWHKDTPDKIIDGEWISVENSSDKIDLKWTAAAYDEDDNATTKSLYTMIYFAPQGDDGDVYFVEDGYYDKGEKDVLGNYDFGAGKNGYASYSFNPKDYTDNITDKAYVWVKVSDGVNGLDLYSDEYVKPDQEKREELVTKEKEAEEKTQVLGDDLKVKGSGKNFSITGIDENTTGEKKLTVNSGTKFSSDVFKSVDVTKVTVSFDGVAGTDKDVKKLFKLNKKKGQITLKPNKTKSASTFMIPVNEGKCTLALTVVNIGFDKALKKKNITAQTGEGSSVSVNLVKMEGKTAKADSPSDFLSAEWFIDGKTKVTAGSEAVTSKKGLSVVLAKDNRTLTVANPGSVKKGSLKITAVVNGKKYKTSIKAKVQ